MKKILMIALYLLTTLGVAAQDERPLSTDSVENSTESIGEINALRIKDAIECELTDRYCVVKKNGKYYIADFERGVNVTDAEYDMLELLSRKKIDEEYYSYFLMEQDGQRGIIGITETSNEFITILLPKE